jgi:hypothetical protein
MATRERSDEERVQFLKWQAGQISPADARQLLMSSENAAGAGKTRGSMTYRFPAPVMHREAAGEASPI